MDRTPTDCSGNLHVFGYIVDEDDARPLGVSQIETLGHQLEEPPIVFHAPEFSGIEDPIEGYDGTNPSSQVLGAPVLLVGCEHDTAAGLSSSTRQIERLHDWGVVSFEPARQHRLDINGGSDPLDRFTQNGLY